MCTDIAEIWWSYVKINLKKKIGDVFSLIRALVFEKTNKS